MAATLSDIAKMTGLSISTVSRAIKNDRQISPETIMTVRKASEKVGYRSPMQKRISFLKNRAEEKKCSVLNICLLFPYPIKDYKYTRLDMLTIDALENRAHELGVSIQTTRLTENGELPEWVMTRKFDAVIMKSSRMPSRTLCPLLYEMPVASIFGFSAFDIPGIWVTSDNSRCADLVWDTVVNRCGCSEIIVPVVLKEGFELSVEFKERLALLKYHAGKKNVCITELEMRPEDSRNIGLLEKAIRSCPGKPAVFLPRLGWEDELLDFCSRLPGSSGIVPGKDCEIIAAVYDYAPRSSSLLHWIDLRGAEIARTALAQLVISLKSGTPLLGKIQIAPELHTAESLKLETITMTRRR